MAASAIKQNEQGKADGDQQNRSGSSLGHAVSPGQSADHQRQGCGIVTGKQRDNAQIAHALRRRNATAEAKRAGKTRQGQIAQSGNARQVQRGRKAGIIGVQATCLGQQQAKGDGQGEGSVDHHGDWQGEGIGVGKWP